MASALTLDDDGGLKQKKKKKRLTWSDSIIQSPTLTNQNEVDN